MEKMVPAWYYQNFDADYTLEHPGQSFGGWKKAKIPLAPAETAVLLMHGWRCDGHTAAPATYRLNEYLDRAGSILENRFPGFLETVRQSRIRLIHIGSNSEKSLPDLPGYARAKALAPAAAPPERIAPSDTSRRHWQFLLDNVLYGHNMAEFSAERRERDFHFLPHDDEDVACTSDQLFALCKHYGIRHLIYTGFAVNACLAVSPCGFVDMSRRGLICSVVRELTTAVENRESCAEERHKEYGLWNFSLLGGFVFDQADLETHFFTK